LIWESPDGRARLFWTGIGVCQIKQIPRIWKWPCKQKQFVLARVQQSSNMLLLTHHHGSKVRPLKIKHMTRVPAII
jgi:tRNA1(Val) A37 N6-methylase TrmN6